jgi:hypothetical protein
VFVFAIGCVSTPPVQSGEASIEHQQRAAAPKPDVPAKAFVDEWFKIYSDALSDLASTRGHWGVNDKGERVWIEPEFGMSRIPRIPGHNLSRDTQYLGDRKKLESLMNESPFYGQAWGYGARTGVLTKDKMRVSFSQFSWQTDKPWIKEPEERQKIDEFAKSALAKLEKGEIPTMKLGDWDVQGRLVRLTDKECLRCHVDNEQNDPVAVFVFATRPR